MKPALDRDHESEWYYTTESRVVYDVHLTKHPLLLLGQRVVVLWSGVVSRKKYHILHPGIPGELSNQWAIKRLLRTNMINHLQFLKENHKSHLCCELL